LLKMAQNELALTQVELGVELGVSRRTIIRWGRGQTYPSQFEVETLVDLLRSKGHDDLAESFLEAADLPIHLAPRDALPSAPTRVGSPAPPAVAAHLLESVVYAAADAADVAPREARLVLRAAFLRAKALGVSSDAIGEALDPQ
jgi:hypothetical protein